MTDDPRPENLNRYYEKLFATMETELTYCDDEDLDHWVERVVKHLYKRAKPDGSDYRMKDVRLTPVEGAASQLLTALTTAICDLEKEVNYLEAL